MDYPRHWPTCPIHAPAEVWDLTPQTGGELMHYYQPPTGDLSIDLLGNRVPVDLVMWSITLVRDELAGYR